MFSGLGAALIGGGLSFGGSMFGSSQSAKAAKDAAELSIYAAKNRHRWEVKDLRKAGLNPILSAHNGAPLPNIPMAQVQDYGRAGSAAVEAMSAKKQIELAESQKELQSSQKVLAEKQADGVNIENAMKGLELEKLQGAWQRLIDKLGPDGAIDSLLLPDETRSYYQYIGTKANSAAEKTGTFLGNLYNSSTVRSAAEKARTFLRNVFKTGSSAKEPEKEPTFNTPNSSVSEWRKRLKDRFKQVFR